MSPPPVPPSTPYGAVPGSPAPRRNSWTRSGSRIGMYIALVVALLVGATAGGVASRAVLTSSSDTATAPPVTGDSKAGNTTRCDAARAAGM